jgi:spore coat polysaccharide biosynthesis protein SpsF
MPEVLQICMDSATAIFIPVRLSSTRLPLKAMRRIQNKPCIQLLVERVRRSRRIGHIVLCTTTSKNDDELVNLAKRLDIECFRGNDVDILERYRQAAIKYNVKSIVNVDGDDIFCEPSFIDLTSEKLDDADCVLWQDVPLGSSPVGIRTSAIEKICSIKDVSNTETGWTRFFTETGLFRVIRLRPDEHQLRDPSIRLTLDYEQDFRLFEKIYENLKEPFDLKDIVRLLRAKPELAKINANLNDIYMKNFNSKAVRVKLKKAYRIRGKPNG